MSKKHTEDLKALSTPNIRSVLRWLNNNIEKKTKPTELASMKHDKCLSIIEDKYKPADIEKALTALMTDDKPKRHKATPKEPETKTDHDVTQPADNNRAKLFAEVGKLREVANTLDDIINGLKLGSKTPEAASYLLTIGDKQVYVIAAGARGATVIEGPFETPAKALKEWPEAIHEGAPVGLEDML